MLFLYFSCVSSLDDTAHLSADSADTAEEIDPITRIDPNELPASSNPCQEPVLVHVNHVVDGDTIFAQFPQGEEKIRLIGIDTPELGFDGMEDECYAQEARSFLQEAIDEKKVWLTFDKTCTDVYGRLLAYVHTDVGSHGFVQRQMLQRGMGPDFPFDDTPTFNALFAEDAQQAKEAQLGGWGRCSWE